MAGHPLASVLEAINFFPVLGRVIRKLFHGDGPTITDSVIDSTIAENNVTINTNQLGQRDADGASGLEVIQASGPALIIKQLVVVLVQEPVAAEKVQRLVTQYPDDGDLGYQVCRYVITTMPHVISQSRIVESNHSYWTELNKLVEENKKKYHKLEGDNE